VAETVGEAVSHDKAAVVVVNVVDGPNFVAEFVAVVVFGFVYFFCD
jgi:hypothetical protein